MRALHRRRALAIAIASLIASPVLADTTPIDLSGWTPVTLDLSAQAEANWIFQNDNTTAIQTRNADPSFLLRGVDETDYEMEGTWFVPSSRDDDVIGFTFGHQDPAHCYVLGWKRGPQSGTLEGFRIFKVEAPDVGSLVSEDFAPNDVTAHSTVLASQFGATEGWVPGVVYTFRLVFSPGTFTVTVKDGDTILWDVTVFDSTYTSGQFGFFNSSQENVHYSGFVRNDRPVCDAGGPYIGDAGVQVQFDGTGSFDPDGSIVSYEWDFGDGETGSGPAPVHTYVVSGTYPVSLCVTDDQGSTSCCSSDLPAVPAATATFGALKARF